MIEWTESGFSLHSSDPPGNYIWAGPNRWSLRAAAKVLEEALVWFHAHEDLGRKVPDEVLEAADDRFWRLLNELIYDDAYGEDLQ